MVSVPASNVVDCGFDARSIQTNCGFDSRSIQTNCGFDSRSIQTNCGFDPRSIQTKDNKIIFATSQLSMYHKGARVKRQIGSESK